MVWNVTEERENKNEQRKELFVVHNLSPAYVLIIVNDKSNIQDIYICS